MNIAGMGIGYPDGEILHPPIDGDEFARRLSRSLERAGTTLRAYRRETSDGARFRSEREARQPVDWTDPRAAGWTFLVHREDPERDGIVNALRPLAVHRHMTDPDSPLVYCPDVDWGRWMTETYGGIPVERRPHYVMIVGGPDRVPFRFQALLGVAASTGRVSFEDVEQLGEYARKILRLEQAPEPNTNPRAVFFGPDGGKLADGSYDPTFFSSRHMVEPLAARVSELEGYAVDRVVGPAATREALLERIRKDRPALLYVASHGVGATKQPLDVQRRINGAICCQRTGAEKAMRDYLLTAEDVPANDPFLEGAIVFLFACHGYGTPALSDFARWDMNVPERNSTEDFVAALPKALLRSPRGPIAFIGHVDTAWLHGFDDPDDPLKTQTWHPRLVPFRTAIETVLGLEPAGLAMKGFAERYNFMNGQLASVLEMRERGEYDDSPERRRRFATDFIMRGDSQNYFVFGDPAAKVRVAKTEEEPHE